MKKILFFTVILLLFPIFQVTLASNLTYNSQGVLNLIFVFSLSLYFAGFLPEAYLAAVVGGLLVDLTGFSGAIGLFGLLMVIYLFGLSALKNLTQSSIFLKFISVFLGVLFLRFWLVLPVRGLSSFGNYLFSTLIETLIFFALYPIFNLVIRRVLSQDFLQLDFRDRL